MSGGRHVVAGRMAERADLLAYLKRRCDNADAIARRYPDFEPFAADRRRQLEVVIADIEAEMHLGAAQVEADRASGLRAAAGQIADQSPPTAYLGRYPNHEHRSLAEVAEDEGGGA